MRHNIVFGGGAGTGPNILTHLFGEVLVKRGYSVFYSRDYQSLVRGGHNFNVLSFSDTPIFSNESKIDILVCLDDKTKELHEKELKKEGIILEGKEGNMYFAGKMFKLFGLNFNILDRKLKELEKRYEGNVVEAKKGYEEESRKIFDIKELGKNYDFMNGSQGVSNGALKSGMDIYYAYPMTPATPVLNELAAATLDKKNKHIVVGLENEIAVANAGVGSAITGAKVMVGTSGGGFDLMTETLSLCGIAEIPLIFYLAQRPGPATGIATYTSQGDLNLALNAGHGEFQRVVLAPGNPKEAQELTNQAFYFSHKYKIPSIILSDKHLGESFYSEGDNPKFVSVISDLKLKKFNSYETDATGVATENPEIIKKNVLKRAVKKVEIEKEAREFERYKIFGNVDSDNVLVSWGSTKGTIIDAIKELDCKFIQILYLDPFPEDIKKELEKKKVILIENNSTGSLGDLIMGKTGVKIEKKILRFDGRPFLLDELKEEIEVKLK